MRQILFKFEVQQHPKPVLLFIKVQLIYAAHGRVILLVNDTIFKKSENST